MKIITTYKMNNGAPIIGLTPIVTITDITDMENSIPVIEGISMYDIGSGFYGYIFEEYENGKEYTVYIDANSGVPNRYQYGTLDKFNMSNLEEGLDFGQMMRVMFSVLAGESSGGGTNSVRFKSQDKSKNRIVANVDDKGNRLLVTIDSE